MDSVKSPDLAKRFSDKVPTTVNEMMERLDDFVRSEEAYANTEFPKGETGEAHHKISLPFNGRDTRPFRGTRPVESRRDEYKNNYRGRDAYRATRARDDRALYPYPRGEYNRRAAHVLTLDYLTKYPKEILATKTQLPKETAGNRTGIGKTKSPSEGRTTEKKGILWPRRSTASKDNQRDQYISEEPLIVKTEVEGYLVRRVYVDEGSSVEVMFEHCFENLSPKIKAKLRETHMDLVGFAREVSKPLEKKQMIEEHPEGKREVAVTEEVLVNPSFPDQLVTIGGGMSETCRDQLRCLLKDNMSVFAWESSDMTGVPRRVIEHALNINPSLDPVCQKRRTFSMEKSRVVTEEVAEWVKSCIVRSMKYPTYISNPVLVKKGDGTWRMCIDFKNLNSACPKDYYPLPNIDCKIAKEDEEKMAFYTDQGTYCYTKMSFGLKNEGATYQILVDSTFQSQIGRNLEAYVDGMVIKSGDEKMLLADIAENFDNLKKINMKLNSKKCSFGVEEGKFLVEAVSAVLLTDRKGRQCPVQYVSRRLNEAEKNYAPIMKLALSLIHMTRKLRRYFEAYPLGAYNIKFIPHNAVKGQVLVDFLSEAPEGTKEDLYFRMPEVPVEKDDTKSWTLFTDGVSSPKGAGAGLVLIGPSGIEYTYALRLTFLSTNNEAEYEALLAGLRITRQMNISNIEVKVDIKLVASQINRDYEANKDSMIKYLAKEKGEVHTIVEEEGDNWMTPIIQCLEEGVWPKDKNEARCLRAKIGQYTVEFGVLFKKGYLVPMLRYVGPLQAKYVIREIHMGSCGMHVGPRAVVRKAVRQGYYWPTMHEDAKKEIEKCDPCQIHAPVLRLPKTLMDTLGPLPPARGGAKFVIVAIDYFTKWIEAKPLVKITGKELENDSKHFNNAGGESQIFFSNHPPPTKTRQVGPPQANGFGR
ncbi:reverse transcriptase domain-containing protein [Tanacetum coccineum]